MSKTPTRVIAEAKLRLWDLLARKAIAELSPGEITLLEILSLDRQVRGLWLERHPEIAEKVTYPNVATVARPAPAAIVP